MILYLIISFFGLFIRLQDMHHLVRMQYQFLWNFCFMCQRTVIKSVQIPQEAIAVLVSAGINCRLMENYA